MQQNDLQDQIKAYFNKKENMQLLYQAFIIITGIILFYYISVDGYSLPIDLVAILIWLILIIMFPIPKAMETKHHSFTELS
ncbi:MAG: hypothetical protein INQ03_06505 [Candidatus Heimdallarchaeota archaeon]|nr:hypothetical protein [Candidatus Heimdallarchaeota archaeon]